MKFCNSCLEIIELDKIKFCPYCQSENVKTFRFQDFIPSENISIVFPIKSPQSKVSFEKVKHLDIFSCVGNRKIKYCILSSDNVEILFHVTPLLLHTEYVIYAHGKRLRSNTNFMSCNLCYRIRENSEFPEYFCFGIPQHSDYLIPNLVGCAQVRLGLSIYSQFYRHYKLQDIFGNYKLDRSAVETKANKYIKKYSFCPHIREDIVKKFLVLLPDYVNPNLDHRWSDFPSSTYKNRFPIITDTQYVVDMINQLYPMEDRTPELSRALEITLDAFTFEINRLTSYAVISQ